jgi:alkyl hydroperoxide reductase subunit F
MDMLRSISSTSPRLELKASYENSAHPQFKIFKDGKPTGITFSGIPGGHEFTSLIVAILNTDGKGKLPE